MSDNLAQRQKIERAYHDKKMSTDELKSSSSEDEKSYKVFYDSIGEVKDKKVLDFGCGDGWMSYWLAHKGAKVFGIDISFQLLLNANKRITKTEFSDQISFFHMTGEQLGFCSNSFDLVVGSAILHHTELEVTVREIESVLRKGGIAIFIEPLNINIFLKLWRFLTPGRRSPTERALVSKDIKILDKYFPLNEKKYFVLTSIVPNGFLIILPSAKIFKKLKILLNKIDEFLLKKIPSLGRFSAVVVLILKK